MATQFFNAPRYVPRCGVPLGWMPLNTRRFVSIRPILTDANRAVRRPDPWATGPLCERTNTLVLRRRVILRADPEGSILPGSIDIPAKARWSTPGAGAGETSGL